MQYFPLLCKIKLYHHHPHWIHSLSSHIPCHQWPVLNDLKEYYSHNLSNSHSLPQVTYRLKSSSTELQTVCAFTTTFKVPHFSKVFCRFHQSSKMFINFRTFHAFMKWLSCVLCTLIAKRGIPIKNMSKTSRDTWKHLIQIIDPSYKTNNAVLNLSVRAYGNTRVFTMMQDALSLCTSCYGPTRIPSVAPLSRLFRYCTSEIYQIKTCCKLSLFLLLKCLTFKWFQ